MPTHGGARPCAGRKKAATSKGRPSDFTQVLADLICERISEGESLRAICSDEALPNRATVFRWLAAHKAFSDQYALAREAQAEALFEDILAIADDSSGDVKIVGEDEREVCNTEFVQRARLRVDARKWMASKLMPKKYGDKLDLNHSGEVKLLPADQRQAEIERLLGKRNGSD